MRFCAIPRGLVLASTLALVGLAAPSAASAAPSHDLVVTIDNVSSPSAKVREARITLENTGPDDFNGCHMTPEDQEEYGQCYDSGSDWQEDPHIAISFNAYRDGVDVTDAITSVPCEHKHGNAALPSHMVCNFGTSLPAGSSISVDVAFAAGTAGGQPDRLEAGLDTSIVLAVNDEDPVQDNPDNSSDYYFWGDEGSCELQAKGPQKASKALVVTVFGGTSGCAAKLKAAKLKIGSKVYTFIKKKPAKEVAPGEKWKVSIPIEGHTLTTANKALAAKKSVKAAAEFDLGGRTDFIVVKLK